MRNVEVRVKLSPSVSERLGSLGERRGLLPASLAAVIIGEYLERHERENAYVVGALSGALDKIISGFANGEFDSFLQSPAVEGAARRVLTDSLSFENGLRQPTGSSNGPEAAAHSLARAREVNG